MNTPYKEGTTGIELIRALIEARRKERLLREILTEESAINAPWSTIRKAKALLAEKPVAIIDCELIYGQPHGPAKAEKLDFELEVHFDGVECRSKKKNFFFHLIDKIKKLWA